MGKVVSSGAWAVACLGLMGACSSSTTEPTTKGSQNLYGGTDVPDAAKLGIVYIQHVPTDTAVSGCWRGTGVLLTNDKLLTAAHVVDRDSALGAGCKPTQLGWLRLTMPDPSVPGGQQVRVISCAASKFCGAATHARYTTAPLGTGILLNNSGEDSAIIQNFSPFTVAGQAAFYRRKFTSKPTASFYASKLTCYGMAEQSNILPKSGVLRQADFVILPFPHPNITTGIGFLSGTMFAVSRGGGLTPTGEFQPNSIVPSIIPVPGDSGGPCIDHVNATDGDIVGIVHSGGPEKSGGADAPSYANITAASGMRNFTRAALGVQAGSIALDLDGDGTADDGVEVRVSAFNTIEIVVTYNSGAQTFPFDTLVPTSAATLLQPLFAGTFGGDFDDDGDSDIIASIGTALSNLPFYFNGALPASFSFTNLPQWQPGLGGYQHYVVGRYNSDAIDDVAAVRFDGSEDVFLGEKNVGLTVPAQFVPRGFSWWPRTASQTPSSIA